MNNLGVLINLLCSCIENNNNSSTNYNNNGVNIFNIYSPTNSYNNNLFQNSNNFGYANPYSNTGIGMGGGLSVNLAKEVQNMTNELIAPPTAYNSGSLYNPVNTNSSWLNFLPMLLSCLTSQADTPLEYYQDDIDISSKAVGDPHFQIANKQAFDFQGKDGGLYKMLDNKDISFNAKFSVAGEGHSKYITEQNLDFKKENVNIVSHAGGKFEIYQDGKQIADQTNYKTDDKTSKVLKDAGIELDFSNNVLTTTYQKRVIKQSLNGANIDNTGDTLMKGDKGLLTQTIGALDTDLNGETDSVIDVNKDGKVDNKDILKYDTANQYMIFTPASATTCGQVSDEIKEKIEKDITAGKAKGSAVLGYSKDHGYSAQQWNEYLGQKLYSVTKDEFLTV